MSITLTAFLEQLETICATKPDYRIGGSGTDGTCDCIGLIIGAVRRAGGSWTGIHGSNYAARKQMADFGEIKAADLFVGEVIYKARKPGDSSYSLPDRYKVGDDLLDYYHVGVVTKVHPLEINISIDGKEKAEDYLACIGGMITDKKNINLYEKWLESQEQEVVHNIDIRKEIVFPLLTFAFCLVAFAGVTVWNVVTSTRISRINDWIYDDQNQSAYQQANERQIYSQKLGSAISQVDQMTENLSTYPDLTDKMLTEIENVSGRDMDVRVQSVDMSTGTLTFNAVSRQVIDIPGYVNILNGTGLFDSVDYTGYSYTDGEYSLMLSCVLKAADAGEGE